jgi:hypothetical protein
LNTEVRTFVRDLLPPSSTYKSQAQLGIKIGFTNDYSVNGEEMKKDQKEEEDEEEQPEDKQTNVSYCSLLYFHKVYYFSMTLAFRRNMLPPSSRLNEFGPFIISLYYIL